MIATLELITTEPAAAYANITEELHTTKKYEENDASFLSRLRVGVRTSFSNSRTQPVGGILSGNDRNEEPCSKQSAAKPCVRRRYA